MKPVQDSQRCLHAMLTPAQADACVAAQPKRLAKTCLLGFTSLIPSVKQCVVRDTAKHHSAEYYIGKFHMRSELHNAPAAQPKSPAPRGVQPRGE